MSAAALTFYSCLPQPENFRYGQVADMPHCPLAIKKQVYKETKIEQQITLQQALKIALACNPNVEEVLARIRQAEATIKEVDADFLPVISTSTNYVYSNAPSVYLFKKIDERMFNPNTNFNYPGIVSNYETDITCAANIYHGGQTLLNRWKAETGKSLRFIDCLALRNALNKDVIYAYYNCLALIDVAAVMKASEKMIAKELDIAKSRFDEGALKRSDVLFLEVRLAESREEIIRAENSLKLAVASLANLLGGNADTEIEVVKEDKDWIPLPADYESALELALNLRPELLSARKRVEIAAIDIEIAKREFLPRVDAFGKVYWDDPGLEYSGRRTNWVTGIGLSWSLYEGGKRYFSVQKSKATLQELLARDSKTTLSVQLDIKQAYLNFESSKVRLGVAKKAIEHAKENLREVKEQYLEGARSITDYLEAEIMYRNSLLRDTQASYDLKKAEAEIARSVGIFSLAFEDENK